MEILHRSADPIGEPSPDRFPVGSACLFVAAVLCRYGLAGQPGSGPAIEYGVPMNIFFGVVSRS